MNSQEQGDVLLLGVPNITEEARKRFAKPPTERMVRYWLENSVIRAKRMKTIWALGRRSLHQQLDEIASGR